MTNSNQRDRNEADPGARPNTGGRKIVFWIVGLSLVLLAVVLIARPNRGVEDADLVGPATTREEVVASQVPGQSQTTDQPAPSR